MAKTKSSAKVDTSVPSYVKKNRMIKFGAWIAIGALVLTTAVSMGLGSVITGS